MGVTLKKHLPKHSIMSWFRSFSVRYISIFYREKALSKAIHIIVFRSSCVCCRGKFFFLCGSPITIQRVFRARLTLFRFLYTYSKTIEVSNFKQTRFELKRISDLDARKTCGCCESFSIRRVFCTDTRGCPYAYPFAVFGEFCTRSLKILSYNTAELSETSIIPKHLKALKEEEEEEEVITQEVADIPFEGLCTNNIR